MLGGRVGTYLVGCPHVRGVGRLRTLPPGRLPTEGPSPSQQGGVERGGASALSLGGHAGRPMMEGVIGPPEAHDCQVRSTGVFVMAEW